MAETTQNTKLHGYVKFSVKIISKREMDGTLSILVIIFYVLVSPEKTHKWDKKNNERRKERMKKISNCPSQKTAPQEKNQNSWLMYEQLTVYFPSISNVFFLVFSPRCTAVLTTESNVLVLLNKYKRHESKIKKDIYIFCYFYPVQCLAVGAKQEKMSQSGQWWGKDVT